MKQEADFLKIIKRKTAFDRIKPKKREKIMIAAIDEFADSGYELASTNRIAKKSGIAKGALFKYFKTKEKLFHAVTEELLAGLFEHLVKYIHFEEKEDVIDLYIKAINDIYDYFGGNLKMFKFFKMIMTERSGEVYVKLRKKWEPLLEPLVTSLLKRVDLSNLNISIREFAKLFIWLDTGMDTEILSAVTPDTTVDEFKKMYRQNLAIVAKVLKNGIYKKNVHQRS